jgi:hypothetical protein
MNLALTFAQRAYALSLLTELVHKKSETRLQTLVEEFPWILQPRGELLTANQQLKTTIERAANSDDTKDRAGRMIKGMSAEERADFVFLTDANQKTIQIIEIKPPNHELTLENGRQLTDYLDFTRTFHGSATISGLLVGNPGMPAFESTDKRIVVKGWDDVLLQCRAAYVQMLAAMLDRADPGVNDTRLNLVHDFGGDAVWELLERLAERDEKLRALMDSLNRLRSATAPADERFRATG